MTAAEDFGDDRDDDRRDECVDCACDECEDSRRADEPFRRPYGPGYVGALGAVTDAVLTSDALDRLLPLSERWPEPRVVDQADIYYFRDRTPVALADLGPGEAAALLTHIRGLAAGLHEAAARDEELTTSSALAWAMDQAGVPPVAALDPLAWLESSVLVRALRVLAADGGG